VLHVHPSLVDKLCSLQDQAGETLTPAVLLEIIPAPLQGRPGQCVGWVSRDIAVMATRPQRLIWLPSPVLLKVQGMAGGFPGWAPKARLRARASLGNPTGSEPAATQCAVLQHFLLLGLMALLLCC